MHVVDDFAINIQNRQINLLRFRWSSTTKKTWQYNGVNKDHSLFVIQNHLLIFSVDANIMPIPINRSGLYSYKQNSLWFYIRSAYNHHFISLIVDPRPRRKLDNSTMFIKILKWIVCFLYKTICSCWRYSNGNANTDKSIRHSTLSFILDHEENLSI